jgi:hypothetical protein
MSICRFSEGDAYVYYQVDDGGLVCVWCRLSVDKPTFRAKDEREMIAHLSEHRCAGHTIPQEAFDELAKLISN